METFGGVKVECVPMIKCKQAQRNLITPLPPQTRKQQYKLLSDLVLQPQESFYPMDLAPRLADELVPVHNVNLQEWRWH